MRTSLSHSSYRSDSPYDETSRGNLASRVVSRVASGVIDPIWPFYPSHLYPHPVMARVVYSIVHSISAHTRPLYQMIANQSKDEMSIRKENNQIQIM